MQLVTRGELCSRWRAYLKQLIVKSANYYLNKLLSASIPLSLWVETSWLHSMVFPLVLLENVTESTLPDDLTLSAVCSPSSGRLLPSTLNKTPLSSILLWQDISVLPLFREATSKYS